MTTTSILSGEGGVRFFLRDPGHPNDHGIEVEPVEHDFGTREDNYLMRRWKPKWGPPYDCAHDSPLIHERLVLPEIDLKFGDYLVIDDGDRVKATVKEVDHAERTIMLLAEDGRTLRYSAEQLEQSVVSVQKSRPSAVTREDF